MLNIKIEELPADDLRGRLRLVKRKARVLEGLVGVLEGV